MRQLKPLDELSDEEVANLIHRTLKSPVLRTTHLKKLVQIMRDRAKLESVGMLGGRVNGIVTSEFLGLFPDTPRPTAMRWLNKLVERGLVIRTGKGVYQLAAAVEESQKAKFNEFELPKIHAEVETTSPHTDKANPSELLKYILEWWKENRGSHEAKVALETWQVVQDSITSGEVTQSMDIVKGLLTSEQVPNGVVVHMIPWLLLIERRFETLDRFAKAIKQAAN